MCKILSLKQVLPNKYVRWCWVYSKLSPLFLAFTSAGDSDTLGEYDLCNFRLGVGTIKGVIWQWRQP